MKPWAFKIVKKKTFKIIHMLLILRVVRSYFVIPKYSQATKMLTQFTYKTLFAH